MDFSDFFCFVKKLSNKLKIIRSFSLVVNSAKRGCRIKRKGMNLRLAACLF